MVPVILAALHLVRFVTKFQLRPDLRAPMLHGGRRTPYDRQPGNHASRRDSVIDPV